VQAGAVALVAVITFNNVKHSFGGFSAELASRLGKLILTPVPDELKFLAASIVRTTKDLEHPVPFLPSDTQGEAMLQACLNDEDDKQWIHIFDNALDQLPETTFTE